MKNVNKLLMSMAAAGLLASAVPAANAATATSNFNVTVALTGVCSISTAPGNVAFTYVANQNTAATANTTYGVTCTNGLTYSMALDATTGSVYGLNYSLVLRNSGDTADITGNQTGSGAAQSYRINGNMVANQAGDLTAPDAGTQQRTLTVTY